MAAGVTRDAHRPSITPDPAVIRPGTRNRPTLAGWGGSARLGSGARDSGPDSTEHRRAGTGSTDAHLVECEAHKAPLARCEDRPDTGRHPSGVEGVVDELSKHLGPWEPVLTGEPVDLGELVRGEPDLDAVTDRRASPPAALAGHSATPSASSMIRSSPSPCTSTFAARATSTISSTISGSIPSGSEL